jgi:threonine aldolase
MHEPSDFRSDKCALPTPEMIDVMTDVEWGDGQDDEGPTVRELERLAAELTGKPAALFTATGILANQLAVKAHTRPGDEIIVDENCHIICSEAGSAAMLSGVQTFSLPSREGRMDLSHLEGVFARAEKGAPDTLVCTENTHNFGGGRVMPLDYLKEVRTIAGRFGAKVHMDGARITNASVKSGIPVAEYAATADSLMFCLSKGLCAPIGSLLSGDEEFIRRARHFRNRIGASPKQSAPLAKCGIIALTTMVDRLKDDHETAARLEQGLRSIPGVDRKLDIETSETNMVFLTLKEGDPDAFIDALAKEHVRAYHIAGSRLRFATHRDVDDDDVERVVRAFRKLLFQKRSR